MVGIVGSAMPIGFLHDSLHWEKIDVKIHSIKIFIQICTCVMRTHVTTEYGKCIAKKSKLP